MRSFNGRVRACAVALGACAAMLIATQSLRASECAGGCDELVNPEAFISPELSCVHAWINHSPCDCWTRLEVVNTCDAPLEAVDFELTGCELSGAAPCTLIESGDNGYLRMDGWNRKEDNYQSYQLRHEGDLYTLYVNWQVIEDEGEGCSVRPGSQSRSWLAGLLLVAVPLLRRRRR